MKYKAVLFDLDGTLLNTLDDIADSMNAVLESSGFRTYDKEAYKYFIGNGLRNLVTRTLPEKMRDNSIVDNHLEALKGEYNKKWDKKTRPYEGIPSLLDNLSGMGIKLTILSNKADYFTKLIVEKLLSKWNFDIIFGERTGIPKKPDPEAALEISRHLRIPVNEFLYLGDTIVDMQTAIAAGMYPVGALWGFRKADELVEGGARVLIANPIVLLDLF